MAGCQLLQMSTQIFLVCLWAGRLKGTGIFLFHSEQVLLLSLSPPTFFLECEFLKPEGAGNGEAGTELGVGTGRKQKG